MTPLLTALSSLRAAERAAAFAFSASPAATASRVRRIAVLSSDLTALLRWRAFSLVLLRLIWDLMFATKEPSQVRSSQGSSGTGKVPEGTEGIQRPGPGGVRPQRPRDTAPQITSSASPRPNRPVVLRPWDYGGC